MTTIAVDDTMISADGLRTAGSEPVGWSTQKLHYRDHNGHRCVYAVTGEGYMAPQIIDWWEAGAKPGLQPMPPKDGSWTLIIVDGTGVRSVNHDSPYPQEWESPQAWGSGSHYALGAMHAGQSAERAVEIASRLDLYTGGKIQSIPRAWLRQQQAAE